jgi:tRNA(His) 5'-end guanylyltransferase
MKNDLEDRMKNSYENRAQHYLPRRIYTIVRLNGKSFKNFTRNMKRPYDEDFMTDMNSTTSYLIKTIQGAKLGYVQSDEISILLADFETITTNAWFDGNIQKIVSASASMAAAKFNQLRQIRLIENQIANNVSDVLRNAELAEFDVRVFTIADPTEVENYFIWRQKDAIRNSIIMTAQNLYSYKVLYKKNQSDMQKLIYQAGGNWNNMNEGFKWGRTITKSGVNNFLSIDTPDFLKERIVLTKLIPKY